MPLRFIYALFDELPETLCSQLIASRFHDELLLNRTAQLSLSVLIGSVNFCVLPGVISSIISQFLIAHNVQSQTSLRVLLLIIVGHSLNSSIIT